ncbi:MAG: nucleoside monophosphate kinase [Defluviitaleaceae bacterium]|nr:nucleoside monophosphate kinase [Defluviitaleaceae bacterium]
MKLIIMGPIGSGKGTQAKILAEKFGLTHLSTGDIMRKHIKDETEIGKKIKSILDSGGYVDDTLTTELLKQSLTDRFILDGYPRTNAQVSLLEGLTSIDKVIFLEADEKEVIERISSRLSCLECGKMYNLKDGVDICTCGNKLVQREDDKKETIEKRLAIFKKETLPIAKIYEDKGLLVKVSGEDEITAVTEVLISVLNEVSA